MEIHTKSTQELIAQANSAYPHFKSLDSSASANSINQANEFKD